MFLFIIMFSSKKKFYLDCPVVDIRTSLKHFKVLFLVVAGAIDVTHPSLKGFIGGIDKVT